MEPVSLVVGTMAPLPRANVDTDQIIPKQFLKRVERSGFGPFLFYDWARDSEGELDPHFVLNRPEYQGAKVLVSGPNFGSGSSREHAPWAIEDWGFEAVIAPSFGDIFRNNCYQMGLLPIELSEAEVIKLTEMAEDHPKSKVAIDLEAQTVTAPGFEASFEIDPFAKHNLMNGFDPIALTLRHAGDIDSYEAGRPGHKPSLAP